MARKKKGETKEPDTKTALPAKVDGGELPGRGPEADGGENRNLPVAMLEGSSEIQAAILLAKKFPRDEVQAQASIMTICDKQIFAEGAFYAFPRGRKLNERTGTWEQNIVTGPSIRMAREAARIYGNFRYGFMITHEDDDGRQIVAYAWDVQANNRTTSSDYFKKLIQRRIGSGASATTIPVTPDERELRELTNRRASILMRNCILSLLPSYFIDGAVQICRDTVGGKKDTDLADRIAKMKTSFAEIGITESQLAAYLQKPTSQATQEDLGNLRGIYEALKDGVISPQERQEMFGGQQAKEEAKGPGIDPPKLSETDMRPAGERTPQAQTEPKQPEQEPDPGASPGEPKDRAEDGRADMPMLLTDPQKKEIATALKTSKKTYKELGEYMAKNHNMGSLELMTHDEYEDALGFASFIPPDEPPAEKTGTEKLTHPPGTRTVKDKKKATAPAAETTTKEPEEDPKDTALKIISEMTKENKVNMRAQVIGLCNAIKGTDNIVQVTVALGKKEKEIDAA